MEPRDYYTRISAQYFAETFGEVRTSRSLDRLLRTEAVLRIVDRFLARPSWIADLGCGPAQYALPLVRRRHRYLGIDITREIFRQIAPALASHPDVAFIEASVEDLPLRDESVDMALLAGVIEYLSSEDKALGELYRILKPSGIAVLTFPNLLNPLHALRALARPFLAPLIRGFMPQSRYIGTVYASPLVHRVLLPSRLVRKAKRLGFNFLDGYCHGYDFYPANRELTRVQIQKRLIWEEIGRRWQPNLGSNFILSLRKP